jgi:hypothetical protein
MFRRLTVKSAKKDEVNNEGRILRIMIYNVFRIQRNKTTSSFTAN